MSGSHRGGSHRTASGSYRNSGGSGDNGRGPSGSHPSNSSGGPYRGGSGSHRIVHNRPPRRRLATVLVGAAAGVAVCILAVFVVMGVLNGEEEPAGGAANSATSAGEETGPATERSVVPDACEMVSTKLAGGLAPNADRSQSDQYQANDRANQCVWGAYTGANKRALTVELRAIAGGQGGTGAGAADRTFKTERQADESGKGLLPTQRLTTKRAIPELGDAAYVVYAVDATQNSGEATVNVRTGNVLVTVHYSGGSDKDPLAADPAINGAVAAAKETITVLSQSR